MLSPFFCTWTVGRDFILLCTGLFAYGTSMCWRLTDKSNAFCLPEILQYLYFYSFMTVFYGGSAKAKNNYFENIT